LDGMDAGKLINGAAHHDDFRRPQAR